jgi:hypothetical protein
MTDEPEERDDEKSEHADPRASQPWVSAAPPTEAIILKSSD